DEDLALYRRMVVPARDRRNDPARDDEHEHRNANTENDLMSPGHSHRARNLQSRNQLPPNLAAATENGASSRRLKRGRSASERSSPHLAQPHIAGAARRAASQVQRKTNY